jgi:hypothetical protein
MCADKRSDDSENANKLQKEILKYNQEHNLVLNNIYTLLRWIIGLMITIIMLELFIYFSVTK